MLQPASLPPTLQALALVLHVLTGERRDPARLALVGALASLSTLVQRVQSVLASDGAVTLTRDDADELAAIGERASMAIAALAAWPSEQLTDAPLPTPSPVNDDAPAAPPASTHDTDEDEDADACSPALRALLSVHSGGRGRATRLSSIVELALFIKSTTGVLCDAAHADDGDRAAQRDMLTRAQGAAEAIADLASDEEQQARRCAGKAAA